MTAASTNNAIPDNAGKTKLLLFFYLVSGIGTLIVTAEGIMEELGWIAVPAEQSLPESIYVIVTIATYTVGFTLFLGVPAAIVIILNFRKRIEILIPALLLTGAVLLMVTYSITGSGLEMLFLGRRDAPFFVWMFFHSCRSTILVKR